MGVEPKAVRRSWRAGSSNGLRCSASSSRGRLSARPTALFSARVSTPYADPFLSSTCMAQTPALKEILIFMVAWRRAVSVDLARSNSSGRTTTTSGTTEEIRTSERAVTSIKQSHTLHTMSSLSLQLLGVVSLSLGSYHILSLLHSSRRWVCWGSGW